MMRRFHKTAKRAVCTIAKKSGVGFLTLLTVFYSFGGLDLYLGLTTPFAPKKVDAAYTGKHLRTIEFTLGSGVGTGATQTGTDNSGAARASDVNVWAGTSWNAVKGTAGTKTITIPGSGIHVLSAYLEMTAQLESAVNVTDIEMALDVTPGPAAGTDLGLNPVYENTGNAYIWYAQSAVTQMITAKADATGVFQSQTDSDWNSGLAVVAQTSVKGPTWNLATMKLVITYEQDYSLIAHDELKTVRFPLRSTVAGDNGTRSADCSAATCSFSYTPDLPDLSAMADIADAWFEITYVTDGLPSMTPSINGGAAGTAHVTTEAVNDNHEHFVIYRPAIGSPDFATTTGQLDITVATAAIGALSAELVVTYKYSTGATEQVETVQYFMGQQLAAPGTASSTYIQTATIQNGSMVPRNIWFKYHAPIQNTLTVSVNGKIGASASTSATYLATNVATDATGVSNYLLEMGSATTSWSGVSTNLATAVRQSSATGDAPMAVEAFITFKWSGSLGGTVTQTGKFFAGMSPVAQGDATFDSHFSYKITLPETVTKTLRGSYTRTSLIHSNVTSITSGTIIFRANGSGPVTLTENSTDADAYRGLFFMEATTTDFIGGSTITKNTYPMFIAAQGSVAANEYTFNTEMVVTYDAALELKVPSFTQSHFRFYVDNDALLPTDAWPVGAVNLGEDTVMTMVDSPLRNGSSTRIRMSFTVATTTLTAGAQQFKLQYAPKVTTCGAIASTSWFAIGAPGSGTIWRGTAATPVDGTALSGNPPTGGDLLLSLSDRAGTYEESNDTAVNPFAIAVGEDAEYDWNIENNNAATSTTYCFRMVKNDDSPFWSYTYYPEVSTEGYEARTDTWRFYDDETNETPITALAATNTAPINIADGSMMKLRINVREANGENGVTQKFKVQYSTFSDFSSGVSDVVATSTCTPTSGWCYGDGVDDDNEPILSRVLLGSTTANGTHNEGTTTTTFGPLANTATEFEYTIARSGGSSNMTYYFRLYDLNHSRPVSLYGGASYPSLSTDGTDLTVVVSGIATSTATEGITTTVGTAPSTIPFGTIAIGASSTAAHRFDVTTNATEGYQILLKSDGAMLSNNGATIPDVTGTNASPSAWATGCTGSMSGCWGYHSGDDTLLLGSTRFLINDTFAQFATTTSQEVIYNSGPVTNEVTDMIYTTEIHQLQAAGSYTAQLQYIVVPIF